MRIEQFTLDPNHYEVYDNLTDSKPIAEFQIVENRRLGYCQPVWLYGMELVDDDILEIANTTYYEG